MIFSCFESIKPKTFDRVDSFEFVKHKTLDRADNFESVRHKRDATTEQVLYPP